jgi:hypothetical protein
LRLGYSDVSVKENSNGEFDPQLIRSEDLSEDKISVKELRTGRKIGENVNNLSIPYI